MSLSVTTQRKRLCLLGIGAIGLTITRVFRNLEINMATIKIENAIPDSGY